MNTIFNIFTDQLTISITLILLLISIYIHSSAKDINDNKKSIVEALNYKLIIIAIILNIAILRYFSLHFEIQLMIEGVNPISSVLFLNITNALIALNIIKTNKNIILFQKKNTVIISISTALFTYFFYIIKPTLYSEYYSDISQAVSEITLSPIQQFPTFSELFIPITLGAFYFIGYLTIAFELSIFILTSIKNKSLWGFELFAISLLFFFSSTHIKYLEKILTKQIITDKNISYLITKLEYNPLFEKCDNPHLIELNKTGKYWFKSISHNKIIYVEGIWNDHISKEERTLENIEEYRFHPFEEECMKTIK
ncbi:hypothetical protein [Avibacterium paragallinarum]|uniref:Uncharacterized protein n=1 Tax=Avibacterium paragallinarum TaxID=728 RepID=A0A377I8R6_AVIPA|nr:hypothetical protein [Avibacterium paragallinarum]POY47260.1 hypothetical protein C3364_02935 [Avibacterium paragallinarum]RZN74569.1 hypothetical protein EC523_11965 [Avibacterium paragallinarum]STO71583.1 Uncharacterised protein [Avibacterium paragallinarum]